MEHVVIKVLWSIKYIADESPVFILIAFNTATKLYKVYHHKHSVNSDTAASVCATAPPCVQSQPSRFGTSEGQCRELYKNSHRSW